MPTCSPPHRGCSPRVPSVRVGSLAGNLGVPGRQARQVGPTTYRRSSCRSARAGPGSESAGDGGRHPGRHDLVAQVQTASGGPASDTPHLRATTGRTTPDLVDTHRAVGRRRRRPLPRLECRRTATSTVAFTRQGSSPKAARHGSGDVGVFVAAHGGATWVRRPSAHPGVRHGDSLMAAGRCPPIWFRRWRCCGNLADRPTASPTTSGTGATTAADAEVGTSNPVDASVLGRPALVPRLSLAVVLRPLRSLHRADPGRGGRSVRGEAGPVRTRHRWGRLPGDLSDAMHPAGPTSAADAVLDPTQTETGQEVGMSLVRSDGDDLDTTKRNDSGARDRLATELGFRARSDAAGSPADHVRDRHHVARRFRAHPARGRHRHRPGVDRQTARQGDGRRRRGERNRPAWPYRCTRRCRAHRDCQDEALEHLATRPQCLAQAVLKLWPGATPGADQPSPTASTTTLSCPTAPRSPGRPRRIEAKMRRIISADQPLERLSCPSTTPRTSWPTTVQARVHGPGGIERHQRRGQTLIPRRGGSTISFTATPRVRGHVSGLHVRRPGRFRSFQLMRAAGVTSVA